MGSLMLDLELKTNSLFKMESNGNNDSPHISHSVKNLTKSTSDRKQKGTLIALSSLFGIGNFNLSSLSRSSPPMYLIRGQAGDQ